MPESNVFSEVETVTLSDLTKAWTDGYAHYVCTSSRVFWVGQSKGGYGLVVFDEVFAQKGLTENFYCLRSGTPRHAPFSKGDSLDLWKVPSKTPLHLGRIIGIARASRDVDPVEVASLLRTHLSMTARHRPRSR